MRRLAVGAAALLPATLCFAQSYQTALPVNRAEQRALEARLSTILDYARANEVSEFYLPTGRIVAVRPYRQVVSEGGEPCRGYRIDLFGHDGDTAVDGFRCRRADGRAWVIVEPEITLSSASPRSRALSVAAGQSEVAAGAASNTAEADGEPTIESLIENGGEDPLAGVREAIDAVPPVPQPAPEMDQPVETARLEEAEASGVADTGDAAAEAPAEQFSEAPALPVEPSDVGIPLSEAAPARAARPRSEATAEPKPSDSVPAQTEVAAVEPEAAPLQAETDATSHAVALEAAPTEPAAEAEPQAEADPAAEAMAQAEAEPAAEAMAAAEAEPAVPAAEVEPQAEAEPEPQAVAEPQAEAEPAAEAEATPTDVASAAERDGEAQPEAVDIAASDPAAQAPQFDASAPITAGHTRLARAPEPEPMPERSEPHPSAESAAPVPDEKLEAIAPDLTGGASDFVLESEPSNTQQPGVVAPTPVAALPEERPRGRAAVLPSASVSYASDASIVAALQDLNYLDLSTKVTDAAVGRAVSEFARDERFALPVSADELLVKLITALDRNEGLPSCSAAGAALCLE